MSLIPVRLRRLVSGRAGGRCEYCGLVHPYNLNLDFTTPPVRYRNSEPPAR